MIPLLFTMSWLLAEVPAPLVQRHGAALIRFEAPVEDGALVVPFADSLRMTITLVATRPAQVRMPKPLARTPGWREAPREAPRQEKTERGRENWTQTITLFPLGPQDSRLEFAEWQYRVADGDWQPVAITPVTVRVTSQRNVKDETPRDITAIETLPDEPAAPARLPLLWIGAGVLALLAGVLLLRRRSAAVRRTSRQRALAELDRLQGLRLLEAGKEERYYTLLAGVLRRFLEERYGLPARRRATPELLVLLGERPELAAEVEFLQNFLSTCDTVKFAPVRTSASGNSSLAEELRSWLERRREPKDA